MKCAKCGIDHSRANRVLADRDNALTVFIALAVARVAASQTSMGTWSPHKENSESVFRGHILPMVWDWAESAPLWRDWDSRVEQIARVIESMDRACAERIISDAVLSGDVPPDFLAMVDDYPA